ncbi:MAG: MYXO-CTERM sorting domain-containing protein [Phycisphaerales bacterium]
MLSRLSLALVSGLVLTAAASTAQAQVTYNDAVGDIASGINNAGGTLDLVSMEVSNTATDIVFRLTVNGFVQGPGATDWGKFMIGISTGSNGGDLAPNGNGWTRPISMNSPLGGMNYWIGSWVDGGGGAQRWRYNGFVPWEEAAATYTPGSGFGSFSFANAQLTYTMSLASLGLSIGSTFYFDAYSSGGGSGDSAIDSLANPNVAVTGWGGPYTSGGSNPIYSYTVVPAPGAVALLGLAGLMARRRRR